MTRTREVFGVTFSPMTLSHIVTTLTDSSGNASGVRLVVTTNLDHVVNLVKNAAFRAAYATATLATVDGMPVLVYARLRGVKVPRVPGPDLFTGVMYALNPCGHRPFFVVSRHATGHAITKWLIARGFSESSIAYEVPNFGFEQDEETSAKLVQAIRVHRTTHLCMGVGCPKSEIWVHRHSDQLGNVWALGIGAGIDFFVGTERRAPRWMRANGLEWSWRLLHEPKRLYRRYLIDSWLFFSAVRNDLASGGRTAFIARNE